MGTISRSFTNHPPYPPLNSLGENILQTDMLISQSIDCKADTQDDYKSVRVIIILGGKGRIMPIMGTLIHMIIDDCCVESLLELP